MKEAVLGIDLGTSAVKIIAVNQSGHVITSTSVPLNLIQSQPGYSEQDPEEWFNAVKTGIYRLNHSDEMKSYKVKGLSFSGQMHGLVALDKKKVTLYDMLSFGMTRNSEQCKQIRWFMESD